MCDIYYLDQFRAEIFERELTEKIEAVKVAVRAVGTEKPVDSGLEEMRRVTEANLKVLSERIAKSALDLAFTQVADIHNNNTAKVRLIRYAVELCRRAKDDLDD